MRDEIKRFENEQSLIWPLIVAFEKEKSPEVKAQILIAVSLNVENFFAHILAENMKRGEFGDVSEAAAQSLIGRQRSLAEDFYIQTLENELSCDEMNVERVHQTIRKLREYGSKRVVGPLIDILNCILKTDLNKEEDSWCTIMSIAYAFENIKDERTVKPMLKILNRDSKGMYSYRGHECKGIVVRSLGAFGVVGIEPLMEIVFNGYNDKYVRSGQEMALESLKKISNKMALAPLYEAYHKYEHENNQLAEKIKEAIATIEKSPGKECYYCGKEVETRHLQDLKEPSYRQICQPCWERLKPIQGSPEFRTVVSCDWEGDKSGKK